MTMRDAVSLAGSASKSMKSIAEMSTIYAVSLRTLRFYEDKGLLRPTRIGTQRLYGGKDETRLQVILKGKKLGFTLLEIEKIILSRIDENPDTQLLAPDHAATVVLTPALVEKQLVKLTRMREETDAAINELKQRVLEAA